MERNDAVERLRDNEPAADLYEILDTPNRQLFIRALAAEGRATVERMVNLTSEGIEQGLHALDAHHRAARAILDEVAAR